ncbi:hypothetical protein PVAND_013158 [Polypedilum vanderplanki]|uniref:RUN domain-containing protein n=1 Tax=Polypedilum vanderplanki TaxID=319348 RepID=A0A9J6CQM5_POLVA|nr:hypothetical protein PVAND_013158 [Polypedilum vanderplanki]
MNKFLKDKENKYFEERQKYIRETLNYHLSENVKENEYEFKTKNNETLGFCECSSALCYTIEAILLHGLKESFLQILSNFGSDESAKPNPSFWSFVLLFLHKQDIKDIQSLTQLTCEVGYSRAFVRKALNESLLSSYLKNIRKSTSTLKKYYNPYAFLLDHELSETAISLLIGIESYVVFNLPCNSSLLNVWNDTPLQLSGLYTAPLKSVPFLFGEDAAELLVSTSTHNIDIPPQKNNVLSDIYTHEISNSIFSNTPSSIDDFDENEKFENFIRKVDSPGGEDTNEDISERMCESNDEPLTESQDMHLPLDNDEEKMQESQDDVTPENKIGNSLLSGQNSWTSGEPAVQIYREEVEEENAEGGAASTAEIVYNRSVTVRSATIDNQSFESLLEEKMRRNSVNFKAVWERFHKTMENKNKNIPEEEEAPEGYEVIKTSLANKKEAEELEQMVEILCRLTTENGLDQQGFVCKGCKSPLVDISKATVCGFDACYYCSACISKDKYAIPAKIIYNWDFSKYSVSKKAADFISEYQFKPFIDFKILNPDIYSYIDEMNNLQKLRIQLNFIRAYIFTCSESTINELQKLLYGKEHIYETIHLYSVSDLFLIQNGAFEALLKKVVSFGREHCLKCILCSNKGFICEICRRSKIIYAFDVDDTVRCNTCGTVSHINCYKPTQPCPKCERRRKRQIVSILE